MTSPVQSVTFNNSENWIGAGSKSGVVKVFDLAENRGTTDVNVHGYCMNSITITYGSYVQWTSQMNK